VKNQVDHRADYYRRLAEGKVQSMPKPRALRPVVTPEQQAEAAARMAKTRAALKHQSGKTLAEKLGIKIKKKAAARTTAAMPPELQQAVTVDPDKPRLPMPEGITEGIPPQMVAPQVPQVPAPTPMAPPTPTQPVLPPQQPQSPQVTTPAPPQSLKAKLAQMPQPQPAAPAQPQPVQPQQPNLQQPVATPLQPAGPRAVPISPLVPPGQEQQPQQPQQQQPSTDIFKDLH
jgi:hypothetical protein